MSIDGMEDVDWVLVPDDIPKIPPGSDIVSHSLLELRLSIGSREWHYSRRTICTGQHGGSKQPVSHSRRDVLSTRLPPVPQSQSLLFRLPTEIRLYIYDLVFALPSATNMKKQSGEQRKQPSVLTLLETCRRVFYETETIFYSINRLRLTLDGVPKSLSGNRRGSIQALELVTERAITLLALIGRLHDLPNLQSLHIVIQIKDVKYMNVYDWSLLSRQMVPDLAKLKNLTELKVFLRTGPDSLPLQHPETELKFEPVVQRLEAVLTPP